MTNDDWKPVFEEIKRKHERNDAMWNALDAKIGVILGFAVVVLFQVILSSDVSGLAAIHTTTTNRVALAYFGQLFFVDAVVSLVAASIVGFYAFRLISSPETPLEKWVKEVEDGKMKLEEFPGKVAWHLYQWYPINKGLLRRKTLRFQAMFYLFLVGVAFFLARFVVIFISNTSA